MAWLAVDRNGTEVIFETKPYRRDPQFGMDIWTSMNCGITLPKGSIKKLIGRELTWEDEPVKI